MLDSKDMEMLRAMMEEVVSGSEARMTAKIEERITESEARMTARIEERIAESETRMTARIEERVEDTRSMLMAYFESAIEPKFNVLAEGHKLLQETLAPSTRVDRLEEEVATLRSLVMALGVEVAELKKTG